MGPEEVAMVSAKPPGHFRLSRGGCLHATMAKETAGGSASLSAVIRSANRCSQDTLGDLQAFGCVQLFTSPTDPPFGPGRRQTARDRDRTR
jgi:hypothetical protein